MKPKGGEQLPNLLEELVAETKDLLKILETLRLGRTPQHRQLSAILTSLEVLMPSNNPKPREPRIRVRPYPETHQWGSISIEQDLVRGCINGDLGVQVASDGRVWICIDGKALIRFKRL